MHIRIKFTIALDHVGDCNMQSGHLVTPPVPIRLRNVVGYDNRRNDLVYCGRSGDDVGKKKSGSTVVFFGGDVQDFTEEMQKNRDNIDYIKWNLEDTARILQNHFPSSHIFVLRPSRIEQKTFSCFDNFVPGNNYGAPKHIPMHFALQHLDKLLKNSVAELLKINFSPQLDIAKNLLTLIGFSKGCVVLNQLLYEFHYLENQTPIDISSQDVLKRIQSMYWLDSGHSGGKETWITDRTLLKSFSRLGINAHIHVSPYQIEDKRRPWIREEEKLFGNLLHEFGASVKRTVHFQQMQPSLQMHFNLITAFREKDVKNL